MVRHLPLPLHHGALRYGIWGAFGFRLVAVAEGLPRRLGSGRKRGSSMHGTAQVAVDNMP